MIASIVRVTASVLSGGIVYGVWLAGVLATMRRPTAPLPFALVLTAPIVTAAGFALGALLGDLLTNRSRRRFRPDYLWQLAACAAGALVVYPFGPMLIVFGMFAAGTAVAVVTEVRSRR
ncbi:MAG: hypothetical protein WC971_00755 [Coriobacteriia bacterium]